MANHNMPKIFATNVACHSMDSHIAHRWVLTQICPVKIVCVSFHSPEYKRYAGIQMVICNNLKDGFHNQNDLILTKSMWSISWQLLRQIFWDSFGKFMLIFVRQCLDNFHSYSNYTASFSIERVLILVFLPDKIL